MECRIEPNLSFISGQNGGLILETFRNHFGGLGAPIWGHFGIILGGLGGSRALPGSWALSEPLRDGSGAHPGRSWDPSWDP